MAGERYSTREVGRAAARLRALKKDRGLLRGARTRRGDLYRAMPWRALTQQRERTTRATRVRFALDLADVVVGLGPRWSRSAWCRFLRGNDGEAAQRQFERWKVQLASLLPGVLGLVVAPGNSRATTYELDVARALAWSDLVLGLDAAPGEEEAPSVFGPGPWGRPAHNVPAARRAALEDRQGNEEAPQAAGRKGAA